jgi:hypothetical protein
VTDAERALIDEALKPQRLRDLFHCRLCPAITTTLANFLNPVVHRANCPTVPVRAERLGRGLADVERR